MSCHRSDGVTRENKMNTTRIAGLIAGALMPVAALQPLVAQAACFEQPQPWALRLGVHNVDPVGGPSQTAAGEVDVKSKAGLTFNVDYRICKTLTVDLLAALPFTHGITINGQRLASTQHLPPTLSLQYHPLADGVIDPFVGIGVTRTMFFREALAGGARLQLSNTVGYAFQGGVDWHFAPAWFAGIDLRYLQIEPDASVNGAPIGKVKIDPIAYGVNLGYRF